MALSLFANKNAQASQPQNSSSIFGNSQPQNTGSSLFGNNNQQQNTSGSLFGNSTSQNQTQGSGGFGNAGNNQTNTGGGLFGNPSQQNSGGSLFGSNTNQASSGGLFGNNNNQTNTAPGGGLFGNANQQSNTGGGLFGNTQQNQSGGLFGGSQQKPSLFSNTTNQPQQGQQAQGGLFSGFGSTNQQQQQQPLGGSEQSNGNYGKSLWQQQSGLHPREKTIPEQMATLADKWDPNSANCLYQKYFYNNVGADRVPYFGPETGEDEQKWEDALSKRPSDGVVPVLCKGFLALGKRLEVQVHAVRGLQARLHEINNSLTAQQQQHDLEISVRATDAKRRHIALSQRCLQLATKVQVLRNRGYIMDAAEERLKKKVSELEKNTFDPSLSGRQEEIWAKLVGIQEHARILQQEAERATVGFVESEDAGIDDEVLKRTKKILQDYDSQINHLATEVTEIRKDFDEWEGKSTVVRPAAR